MLVVGNALICWMRWIRIVRLHANIVSHDLHVLCGNCEPGEGVVPHNNPAEMVVWGPALAGSRLAAAVLLSVSTLRPRSPALLSQFFPHPTRPRPLLATGE